MTNSTTTGLVPGSWSGVLVPQIKEMAQYHQGTQDEKEAQAARDILESYTDKQELSSLVIGGLLNNIKNQKRYTHLGYRTMDEFIAGEKVANLGRTQCIKYMTVAAHTSPPGALQAPTLGAHRIDTQAPHVTLPSEVITEIGPERAYTVIQKWKGKTPEEREELLDCAQSLPAKAFYDQVYGKEDSRVSFEIAGDEILLWKDSIGEKVAQITTLDPFLRALLGDRLGTIPRARL